MSRSHIIPWAQRKIKDASKRVSKTMDIEIGELCLWKLGALPLGEGEGAKYSPPGLQMIHDCDHIKNHFHDF